MPERASLVQSADDEIVERITQVRGIGRWTVEMMLMFQLGRPDVLPVDDFGVRTGFRLAYGLRKMPPQEAKRIRDFLRDRVATGHEVAHRIREQCATCR